jgi:DNA-binding NarL/FixJ family response regulator
MSTTPVIALSQSASFNRHLAKALPETLVQVSTDWLDYQAISKPDEHVLLIHGNLLSEVDKQALGELATAMRVQIGIAADVPNLSEALEWIPLGIRAYFNSHMADTHYRHMLQALQLGQSWFSPQILQGLVGLAQNTLVSPTTEQVNATPALDSLTPREREIAEAVSSGMKNKKIAEHFSVTERTVKAHLSNIFQKLGVKDRLELAVMLHGKETA